MSSSLVDWLNRNGRIWELLDAAREGPWQLRCTIDMLDLAYGQYLAGMLRDRYGPDVARLLVDEDVGLMHLPAEAAAAERHALLSDGRRGADGYDLWGDGTTTGVDVIRRAAEREVETPPRPADLPADRLLGLYGVEDLSTERLPGLYAGVER